MALNSSGPISLGGSTAGESVNLEIGQSATTTISFNDAAVRTLTGTSSNSALSLPSGFWGKSSVSYFLSTYNESASLNSGFDTIQTDASGNIYVTGSGFTGPVILKYASSGTYTSNVKFTTSSITSTTDISSDSLLRVGNNLYMGVSEDLVSGDTVSSYATLNTSLTPTDFKYNNTYVNPRTLLTSDASNNLYVINRYQNSSTNVNYANVFKYDSSGNLLWSYKYNCANGFFANDCTTDPSGNLYLAGRVYTSSYNSGGLVKIDSSGSVVWSTQYKASASNQGGVFLSVVANNSEIYVGVYGWSTGQYYGPIFKFDTNGSLIFAKGVPYFNNISASPLSLYSGGLYAGYNNGAIIKFDSSLNVLWCNKLVQSPGNFQHQVELRSVKQLSGDSLLVAGVIGVPTYRSGGILGSLPTDGTHNSGSTITVGSLSFTYAPYTTTSTTPVDISAFYTQSNPGITATALSNPFVAGSYGSTTISGTASGPTTV